MSSKPQVSILINNYNYARFLPEAIESALNQTYRNCEVIVVDDGSTDNSRDVLAGFDTRIVAILKANGGQASAFNAGFAASRGDWVFFLDADDYFLPEKIGTLMKFAGTVTDVGFVVHNMTCCDIEGRPISFERPSQSRLLNFDYRRKAREGKLGIMMPTTSGLGLRRDVLEKILPMPEDIAITADNYMKVAGLALTPLLWVPSFLGVQRIHPWNLYTRVKETELDRLNQAIVGAKISYRLKEKFPFLSKIAWKSYGQALFRLASSRHSNKRNTFSKIHAEYNLFEFSLPAAFYIGAGFISACGRQLRQFAVQTLAGLSIRRDVS